MMSATRSPFYRLRELFQDAIALAPGITDKRRLLALLLVRRSDEYLYGRCGELIAWIGANKLALAMRCDRRTVQRGLAWLLESGLLELERKGGGRARSSRYRFSKRWLAAAAVELEKSGVGDAYGLPDDLFAFANGGGWTAEAVRYGGADAADTAQNSGAFADDAGERAASEAEKGGNVFGKSGAAAPPEIERNNRNRGARPNQRAAQDPRQGYLTHAIPGGRGESDPTAVRRLADLRHRAAVLLGDDGQASIAVSRLRPDLRRKIEAGLRPSDDDLRKWLVWALEASADETAAPAPPAHQEDRLTRVERLAAETAASVSAISGSVADLMTLIRAIVPADAERSNGGAVAA